MPTPADVRTAALDARTNYSVVEAVTTKDLQDAYYQASADVAKAAAAATPGTLTKSAQARLATIIQDRANSLNDESMAALRAGIRQAYVHSTEGTNVVQQVLASVFGDTPVQTMVQDANERAALAHLTRTGKDGLQLSNKVWGATETWQGTVNKLVQDAVVSGKDARKLAKELAPFVSPGAQTTQHKATARRLGVPANTSYPAMRLARTELQQAFHEGTINGHSKAPSYKGIRWRLSGSHPGTGPNPDICNTLALGKAGDGSGFWPKGEEPTKPHPQCWCTAIPVHTAPDEFLDELEGWLKAPQSNPALQQWYQQQMGPYLQLNIMPIAGGAVGASKYPPGWAMGDKVTTYVGKLLQTGTIIGAHSDGSLRVKLDDAQGTLVWRKPSKLEKTAPPAAPIVTPPPPPPPASLAIDKTTKGAYVYAMLDGVQRPFVVKAVAKDGYLRLHPPPGADIGAYAGLPKTGFVWRKPDTVKLAEPHLQPGYIAPPPSQQTTVATTNVPVPPHQPPNVPLHKVGDIVEVLSVPGSVGAIGVVGMKLPITEVQNGIVKVQTPFDGPIWLAPSQFKAQGTPQAPPAPPGSVTKVGDVVHLASNNALVGVLQTEMLHNWVVKLPGGGIDYWPKGEVTKLAPLPPPKVGDQAIVTTGPKIGQQGEITNAYGNDYWIVTVSPTNSFAVLKTDVAGVPKPTAPAPPPPVHPAAPQPPPAPPPPAPAPVDVTKPGTLVQATHMGLPVQFTSGGIQGGFVKLYPYGPLPPGTSVPKSGFFWKKQDKVTAAAPAAPPGAAAAAPTPVAHPPAPATATPTPAAPAPVPAPPPPGVGRASYAPPPSMDLPKLFTNLDAAELQAIMGVGSAHVAKFKIFTDDKGDHWLFKPQAASLANLDAATGLLAKEMGFADAWSETYVTTYQGVAGSLQKMSGSSSKGTRREAFGKKTDPGGGMYDPVRAKAEMNYQLQEHSVFNWLIDNHDAHKDNFVKVSGTGGRLKGIDKGQAFKFFGQGPGKPTKDYDPNNNLSFNGGSVYNALHTAYADKTKTVQGFANLHGEPNSHQAQQLKAHITKLQNFDDAKFKEILRPFAEQAAREQRLGTATPYNGGYKPQAWQNDAEAFLEAALKRKRNLLKDWQDFHKELWEERYPPPPPPPPLPANLAARLKGTATQLGRQARSFATARAGKMWAKPIWEASYRNLDYASRSALSNYQGSGYRWMNNSLRQQPTTNLAGINDRADIEAVDRAMVKTATPEDIVVVRGDGQSGDPWRNQGGIHSLVGTVQQQKGFWSTSVDSTPGFEKPYVLHIRVPAGTPAFFLDLINDIGERELLLGRGLKYYVHKVEEKQSPSRYAYGGTSRKTHVYLEVLPPDLQEGIGRSATP